MEKEWVYINSDDNSIRYALGVKGNNTLVCFGINPSTAEPNKMDNTIRKVDKIASKNGFDSWIMLNVYPKRDTNFDNLSSVCDDELHLENVRIIKEQLSKLDKIKIWVAFGDHIFDRNYLINCWKAIYSEIECEKNEWLTTGINKSGAPKHPLYQKDDSTLKPFDMRNFVNEL